MRIEICIAKEKMTKMPHGAVDALKEELTRRISKRYDDVEVIVKATSNDGLSVTRTADKDSAKTFVQETLKPSSTEQRIFSSGRAASKAGNTQSIPPLWNPSSREKSLAVSSRRFIQSFLRLNYVPTVHTMDCGNPFYEVVIP